MSGDERSVWEILIDEGAAEVVGHVGDSNCPRTARLIR